MTGVREGDELPPTRRRWPDDAAGPWNLVLLWQQIDGRPECIGLRLEAPVTVGEPAPVLTGAVLRRLRLPEIVAADRAKMMPAVPQAAMMRTSTAARLKLAAEIYRSAIEDGHPPTKAVAEHFEITAGGASNLISRARAAGFLPPTSAGVPMG